MLDRLFEVVLIEVLRVVLARPEVSPGLFRSLLHPQISKALTAIHTEPSHDWSLAELAQVAGMSRSSFASTFKNEVGETPGNYLTRWRITLAQALIQEGVPLKLISDRIGYNSQAGFLRAFKIIMGESPTSWKKSHSK